MMHPLLLNDKRYWCGISWKLIHTSYWWWRIKNIFYPGNILWGKHSLFCQGRVPRKWWKYGDNFLAVFLAKFHNNINIPAVYLWSDQDIYGYILILHGLPVPGEDLVGTKKEIQQAVTEVLEIFSHELDMYSDEPWLEWPVQKIAYNHYEKKTKTGKYNNRKNHHWMPISISITIGFLLLSIYTYTFIPNIQQNAMAIPCEWQNGQQYWQKITNFFMTVPLEVAGWNLASVQCAQDCLLSYRDGKNSIDKFLQSLSKKWPHNFQYQWKGNLIEIIYSLNTHRTYLSSQPLTLSNFSSFVQDINAMGIKISLNPMNPDLLCMNYEKGYYSLSGEAPLLTKIKILPNMTVDNINLTLGVYPKFIIQGNYMVAR